jgi:acyl dehydratase
MEKDVVTLDFGRRPSALPYMVRAMLPVARHRDLAPRLVARWHAHRPDRADLAEFCRITALAHGDHSLPLLYPHAFGFRLAMAILTHPRFPVPIWGVLQTRNHLQQFQSIPVDATLDFETRVLEGRVVAKGAEFDLRTTVRMEGALAWQSDVTFFTRVRFGEPTPAPTLSRAPAEFGPVIAEWTMDDADHVRFGRFTGDYNGIHLWDWYARRMGFRRALYHPPRILGRCLAHLTDAMEVDGGAPGLRLDAWLKGPVTHGARVRLHASIETGTFALFAGEDRPSFVGCLRAGDARGGSA